MARPSGGYKLASGEKCPGVTTILNRFQNSGGLIHWAWQQGKDGKDFRETRDRAADAGTCVHEMIEADWRGKLFDRTLYKPEALKKADHAFLGYLEWKDQTKLNVVKGELPLVSEVYKFGGTMDALMIRDRLVMGDWKTSNGIYAEHVIQVAGGYSILWNEHFPDQPLDGVQILRFSKPEHDDDPISFHAHYFSAEIFPIAQRQFIILREAFDLDKRISKLV